MKLNQTIAQRGEPIQKTHDDSWEEMLWQAIIETARLRGLLREARKTVEYWTPDECNAFDDEPKELNKWYVLRDRIDAALGEMK